MLSLIKKSFDFDCLIIKRSKLRLENLIYREEWLVGCVCVLLAIISHLDFEQLMLRCFTSQQFAALQYIRLIVLEQKSVLLN